MIYKIDASDSSKVFEARAEDVISYIRTYHYNDECYKAVSLCDKNIVSEVQDAVNAGKSDEAYTSFEEGIKDNPIKDFEETIKDSPVEIQRLGFIERGKLRDLRELLRMFV